MDVTILLERVSGETRMAVLEDRRLCELYYDRPGREKLAGNIYLGRVQNTLKGMDAAFIDIGLDKNAFMQAEDLPLDRSGRRRVTPGQELPVQVTKEPGGTKGCRVSSQITIPGRLSVLLPTQSGINVSRKLESDAERERLRAIADRVLAGTGMGAIVRTAAEGVTDEQLENDLRGAMSIRNELMSRARHSTAPTLLADDGSLPLRLARDILSPEIGRVIVDGEDVYRECVEYARMLAPEYVGLISLHSGVSPAFSVFGVDAQAEKLTGRFVWLDSGGSLMIDETEALTVIDVNTAKSSGRRTQEETILRLNEEAAVMIARLLRLNDIGGIIIIDFIDMQTDESREKLLAVLREALKRDRNHTNVVGFTGLGLVELTRKKVRRPLSKQLGHQCSACNGRGIVPSHETTARRALRELHRLRYTAPDMRLTLRCSAPIAARVRAIGVPAGITLHTDAQLADSDIVITPSDRPDEK